MRVVVVWKDNTDYAREVIEWIDGFERATDKKVESLDPDTIEGEIFVTSRDMLEYPSVVALDDSGRVLREWKGTPLPQFDQVFYFVKEV